MFFSFVGWFEFDAPSSVVRYVQLPPDGVDIELLHDATRREARGG